jgi:hypothetical protein
LIDHKATTVNQPAQRGRRRHHHANQDSERADGIARPEAGEVTTPDIQVSTANQR